MSEPERYVHRTDPFVTPPDKREPVRRLRGRLVAGVSVWTAGPPKGRAGLTVSSMVVAEGSPSLVLGLMNDTTDLWDTIEETGAFVVHILGRRDRVVADRFAGLRPSPGGLFTDMDVADTEWGPALVAFPDRVFCRYLDVSQAGYQRLVRGEIQRIELSDLTDPLVYFRGRYRKLKPDDADG
jgi:3-hydroxy-9,10-secoandrosta-1,3,5(10)-triene-9,17-dione monooxygenase reductase component